LFSNSNFVRYKTIFYETDLVSEGDLKQKNVFIKNSEYLICANQLYDLCEAKVFQ